MVRLKLQIGTHYEVVTGVTRYGDTRGYQGWYSLLGYCGTRFRAVLRSRHSNYTESNCIGRVYEQRVKLFVHVSDVLYRSHVTSVTNTIYSSQIRYRVEGHRGRQRTTRCTPAAARAGLTEQKMPSHHHLHQPPAALTLYSNKSAL